MIHRLGENSRGKEQALDRECTGISPVMTTKMGEEECMMTLLIKDREYKRSSGSGRKSFGDILLRSVPFEDCT